MIKKQSRTQWKRQALSSSSSRSCLLPWNFPVEKKYRGSQSANTTVVVENLTVKLCSWDEEMGHYPMNVSEFWSIYAVFYHYFFYMLTTSPDLHSVHTTFEVPDSCLRLLGCSHDSFKYLDTFHIGRSSSFLHLYISESPTTAAQLVVRTP